MNAPVKDLQGHNTSLKMGTFQVPLLQESLQCEESRVSLAQLLAAIRRYHHLRDFSHQERFGTPDSASQQHLAELDAVQRQILDATAPDKTDGSLVFQASLQVSLVPAES